MERPRYRGRSAIPSPPPRAGTAAAFLPTVLAALAIAGCGDLATGRGEGANGELTEGPGATALGSAIELPQRPPGVVEIQGELAGSVAGRLSTAFRRSTPRANRAVRAETTDADESLAITALCQGRIDIAAASRPATATEIEACADNRLDLLDLPIAFDLVAAPDRLYPLVRTLRLYTTGRALERSAVRAYLEFQLRRGPGIARNLGLTPPTAELRLRQAERIDSAATKGPPLDRG